MRCPECDRDDLEEIKIDKYGAMDKIVPCGKRVAND